MGESFSTQDARCSDELEAGMARGEKSLGLSIQAEDAAARLAVRGKRQRHAAFGWLRGWGTAPAPHRQSTPKAVSH
jgi:hypothetical protein